MENQGFKEQRETVDRIESAMREKVNQQLPIFEKMPPAQRMKTVQGETVYKNNPAIQEIRALFRDYCAIVKAQQDIYGNKQTKAEVATINSIRERLKIAK